MRLKNTESTIIVKLKFTTEQWIEKAKKVHGDRYDYSLSLYTGSSQKVKIICKEHGVFDQKASKHLEGANCSKCSGNCRHLTTKDFIRVATKIHGDKYDYSQSVYINNVTKVKIICKKHGEFLIIPASHVLKIRKASGCKKCVIEASTHTTQIFKDKASKIHNNVYDYTLVDYVNQNVKVKIICPKCGIFEQFPTNHLQGKGCYVCTHTKSNTTEYFIEQAMKVHGDKYDYSVTNYAKSYLKVDIICKTHGNFKQLARSHLSGNRCNLCGKSNSLGEEKIQKYLDQNRIEFHQQYKFENCLSTTKYRNIRLPFDFYIPNHNLCIEFDGIQHFKPVNFYGGEKSFKRVKLNDIIKNKFCRDNNIELIRIGYYEFDDIENILNNILSSHKLIYL